ncbi:hypothetical protein DTO027B5_7710 [Paecilomyces variotii]|nr:hypothetical protein DTO169C6_5007 [Paecilomyces variotii]KAJ9323409.1 hypothetical protein DTO027B3_5527 [Paecilomyces variotii]KAJ9330510.1 hypothetical protein DTO027B5_7710 [Paecilomyces variotii]KAJ9398160.1 hypothetical protein DTO282F9_4845 [Paecilomyces variotii]
MGGSQSTQRPPERSQRQQRRPSNRLSKPPRSNSSSSAMKANVSNTEAPRREAPLDWRDPWMRNSAPDIVLDSASDNNNNDERGHRRVQSFPSYSVVSFDAPPRTPVDRGNRSWSYIGDAAAPSRQLSRSSSQASNFSVRRSSVAEPSRSRMPPPQRIHSYQFEPQDIEHAIQERPAEEAKYHQDFSSVDAHRFSLIRRKSLLTPGLATREPEAGYRHSYSEPLLNASSCSVEASRTSQWPLYEPEYLSQPIGACSPNEHEYSQLGTLRFGSLRVVNGTSSPSSSDRSLRQGPTPPAKRPGDRSSESSRSRDEYRKSDTRFPRFDQDADEQPKSPPNGSSRAEPKARPAAEPESSGSSTPRNRHQKTVSSPPSLLRISSQLAEGKAAEKDEVPDSPFSFEKSPALPTLPRHSALFPAQVEDEGIHLTDSDISTPGTSRSKLDWTASSDPAIPDGMRRMRRSRTGDKPDSGYSSTTSIWSIPEPTKRDSFSSQTLQHYPYWRSSGISVGGPREKGPDDTLPTNGKGLRRVSSPELGEFGGEATVRRPSRFQRLSTELTRPRDLSLPRSRESRRRQERETAEAATLCRESESRARSTSRFRTGQKSRSTPRPPSSGKNSPPRFYADLNPGSVPPASSGAAAGHKSRGRQEDANDDPRRKRRFSTSQLKNGIKNLLLEVKTGGSKSSSDLKTDRPSDKRASFDSRRAHNTPRTSRSVELPRSRPRARSDPYGGARPASECRIPRPQTRHGPPGYDRPPSRSPARQRSPRVKEEVPPIPTLPTMDEIWKREKRRSSGLLASVMSLDELQKLEKLENRRSDISMLGEGSKSQPTLSTSPPSTTKDTRREDQRRSYHAPAENGRRRDSIAKPSPAEIPSVEERRKSIPKLNEYAQAHRRSVSDITPNPAQTNGHTKPDSPQHDNPRGRARSRSIANPQADPQTQSGPYVTSLRSPPPELFEQQRPRLASPPSARPNGPRPGPNTNSRMNLKLTIPRDPSPVSTAGSDFIDRYPRFGSPKSPRSSTSSLVLSDKQTPTSPKSPRSRRSSVSSEAFFADKNARMRSPLSPRPRVSSEVYDKQARITSPSRVTSPRSMRSSISSEIYDKQARMMSPPRVTSPKSVRSSVSSEAFADRPPRVSSPRSACSRGSSGPDFFDRYPRFGSPISMKSVTSIPETLVDERRNPRFSFESGVSRG